MKEEKSDSFVDRFYNKLTDPRTVRITGFLVLILYIGLVALGVLVAATLKPPYTLWDNWISDLGSSVHTPAPILYDLACIFAGTLTIPLHFYLEKHVAPIPRSSEDYRTHRWAFRLTGLAWFFSMLGSIFYIGVGIWSGNRPELFGVNMHGICSYGAFGGFAIAAIFMGIAFLCVHQEIIPKPYKYIVGLIGMTVPITVAILNMTGLPGVTGPFLEWSLLFAVLAWILPVAVFTLRHAERQLHGEK